MNEVGKKVEDAAEHYGYTEVSEIIGLWENEPGVLRKFTHLSESLDPKRKLHVSLDYDPNYPHALLQITYSGEITHLIKEDIAARRATEPSFDEFRQLYEEIRAKKKAAWERKTKFSPTHTNRTVDS